MNICISKATFFKSAWKYPLWMVLKLVGCNPPLKCKRVTFPLRGVIQTWVSQQCHCCSATSTQKHFNIPGGGGCAVSWRVQEACKLLYKLPICSSGLQSAVGCHFQSVVRAWNFWNQKWSMSADSSCCFEGRHVECAPGLQELLGRCSLPSTLKLFWVYMPTSGGSWVCINCMPMAPSKLLEPSSIPVPALANTSTTTLRAFENHCPINTYYDSFASIPFWKHVHVSVSYRIYSRAIFW